MTLRSARWRTGALVVTSALVCGLLSPFPAAGDVGEQRATDDAVAAAAANGIQQSISVVDRWTGENVASSGGDQQYIAESIVKLFTAAYYQVQAGGHPDPAMTQRLRAMIINSDDDIESSLWSTDIVPAMAQRYGLSNTSNGPRTGPDDWGWELITADDETEFLYKMSNDPIVAPLLTEAMSHEASIAADGFDQHFGLNAIAGDHGSKQGWTDTGSSSPFQVHSVGWTDRYFVAILQTADDPDYDSLRAQSTSAAQSVLAAENSPADSATAASDPAPPTTTADPAATPAVVAPEPAAGASVVAAWITREIVHAAENFAQLFSRH